MTRKFGIYAAVAMMTVSATLAAQSTPQSQSASAKPPWLWSAEERIAKRVDPAERELRRGRGPQKGPRAGAAFTPIDGSLEPELFLPVELVTRLVLNTDPPHGRMRESYRVSIESRSWDYEEFWEVLHSAGAPYLSVMKQSGALQKEARGRADLRHLGLQACSSAAELLNTAYEQFGRQAFDEFLYREVAPHIRSSMADHAETADGLRKQERGCR